MLALNNIVCGYRQPKGGAKVVLENLSLRLEKGKVLCILGANGIGKTTLFKSILGAIPLLGGEITIDGSPMQSLSRRQIAQKIGYVPQAHTPPFPFTVLQIVVMGRTAHLSHFQTPSRQDEAKAEAALEMLGVSRLKDEIYTEISGGERQLALIARALAQESAFLIMDEPTSNLDFGNQIRVLRQIRSLAEQGIGVIFTTHYPNHAFLCAHEAAVIKNKQQFVVGSVGQVVTQPLLQEIYGIDLSLLETQTPAGQTLQTVIPYL